MKIQANKIKNQVKINGISYQDIKITTHAMIRGNERLKTNSKVELQKMASRAKKSGVNIKALTFENCESVGISKSDFAKILNQLVYYDEDGKYKSKYGIRHMQSLKHVSHKHTTKMSKGSATGRGFNWSRYWGEYPLKDAVYLYNGMFWVFTGAKYRTLRTIIELSDSPEDIRAELKESIK